MKAGAFLKKYKHEAVLAVLLLLCTVLFWSLLSSHDLYEKPDGLYSASNVWGDLPVHLALTANFREHGIASTLRDNPIYTGLSVSYPPIPDYITTLLGMIGVPLRWSLIMPSLIAILAFIWIFYYAVRKITGSSFAALLAPVLFLLNGSLWGLWYFISDHAGSRSPLLELISHPIKNYTYVADANLRFANIIGDYILPQRAFVFGLAIGFAAVYFLWRYWNSKSGRDLLWGSILICALPLVHTHSFISLVFVAFFLFCGEIALLLRKKDTKALDAVVRRWLVSFGLPFVAGVLQLWLIFPGDKSSFIHLGFFGAENPITFWVKNLFPQFIFIYLGYRAAPPKLRTFFNAFIGLFLVTSVVIFQPNKSDNMKHILWFYTMATVLICVWLESVRAKTRAWWKWPVIVLVALSVTATGILCVIRELESSSLLFSRQAVELADYVQKNTPESAVFLMGSNHNNPIVSLAGRRILLGYPGWLWSYGIDYSGRYEDERSIYAHPASSKDIVGKYGISYILVDDRVRKEFEPNTGELDKLYPKIYNKDGYVLYGVLKQ